MHKRILTLQKDGGEILVNLQQNKEVCFVCLLELEEEVVAHLGMTGGAA